MRFDLFHLLLLPCAKNEKGKRKKENDYTFVSYTHG